MVAVSFPRVPAPSRPALQATTLRRFGAAAVDLDVDFEAPRAEVTDAILAACARPSIDRRDLGGLTLSVRIRALLRLAALEEPSVELVVTCACGELLELALPIAMIAADPEEVVDAIDVGGRRVRVPTGDDQRRLAVAPSGAEPRLAAARALADDAELDPAGVEAIEAALDAADPLVGFHVTATCVQCGAAIRHELDLEALAQRRLAGAQAALVDAVHRLATAYHWTEADVMALTPRRRTWYLALVERGRP